MCTCVLPDPCPVAFSPTIVCRRLTHLTPPSAGGRQPPVAVSHPADGRPSAGCSPAAGGGRGGGAAAGGTSQQGGCCSCCIGCTRTTSASPGAPSLCASSSARWAHQPQQPPASYRGASAHNSSVPTRQRRQRHVRRPPAAASTGTSTTDVSALRVSRPAAERCQYGQPRQQHRRRWPSSASACAAVSCCACAVIAWQGGFRRRAPSLPSWSPAASTRNPSTDHALCPPAAPSTTVAWPPILLLLIIGPHLPRCRDCAAGHTRLAGSALRAWVGACGGPQRR